MTQVQILDEPVCISSGRWDSNALGQSESRSNSNEEVLHIPYSFRTGASPSDAL